MKTFSLHSERIIRDNKYVSPPPPIVHASARMKALSDATRQHRYLPFMRGDVKSDLVTLGKSCWTGLGSLE